MGPTQRDAPLLTLAMAVEAASVLPPLEVTVAWALEAADAKLCCTAKELACAVLPQALVTASAYAEAAAVAVAWAAADPEAELEQPPPPEALTTTLLMAVATAVAMACEECSSRTRWPAGRREGGSGCRPNRRAAYLRTRVGLGLAGAGLAGREGRADCRGNGALGVAARGGRRAGRAGLGLEELPGVGGH